MQLREPSLVEVSEVTFLYIIREHKRAESVKVPESDKNLDKLVTVVRYRFGRNFSMWLIAWIFPIFPLCPLI